MRAFHSDRHVLPLPEGHRFPMPKYRLLRDRVDGLAGLELADAPAASEGELALAHDPAYVDAYCTGTIDPRAMRRIGFPWSPGLANRTRTALGGTVLAAELALEHGIACNLAGGTHHAQRDCGSGFCIFNDLGVAPRVLRQAGRIRTALIVDLDVHQGDGTAQIFAGDPSVFTFSMHCARNFPRCATARLFRCGPTALPAPPTMEFSPSLAIAGAPAMTCRKTRSSW